VLGDGDVGTQRERMRRGTCVTEPNHIITEKERRGRIEKQQQGVLMGGALYFGAGRRSRIRRRGGFRRSGRGGYLSSGTPDSKGQNAWVIYRGIPKRGRH